MSKLHTSPSQIGTLPRVTLKDFEAIVNRWPEHSVIVETFGNKTFYTLMRDGIALEEIEV